MKILQIVGDSKFGGATYLILEWCRFLIEQDCDVHVLSGDATTIGELEHINGVVVVNTIRIPRDIVPMADVRAVVQLVRHLRRERYDVIHTHTSTPGFIGRLAGWLARTPVRLHTAHGWPVSEFSSLKQRLCYTPLEHVASRLATRVIGVSHATLDQGHRFHLAAVRKLVAICNGIDPAPFISGDDEAGEAAAELRAELGLPNDCFLIGNASRLAEQKDIASLIEAMIHMRHRLNGRHFALLLAGDGPQRQALESLAQSIGVGASVRFLGFRRDIPRFLAALDVFVNPSLWEGLSISLLEAMAAARPIVTTDIEPNRELIEHEKTGLVVPPKAPEAIAAAIARLADDGSLAARCAAAARVRLLQEYTIERMKQAQWKLYRELCEAVPRRQHMTLRRRATSPQK